MSTFGGPEPRTAVLPEPVPGTTRATTRATGTTGTTGVTGAPRTPGARTAAPGTAPAAASRPPEGAARPAWERTGEPGRNHDPHEVTVQLDGVGRRLDGGRTTAPGTAPGGAGPGGPAGLTGSVAEGGGKDSDGPVFVDESGRRSRRIRRIGIAVGIACGAYAVVIVATLLSGSSAAPWIPVPIPGAAEKAPASKVEDTPGPSHSAAPTTDTGGVLPGAGADPGDPTGAAALPADASASPGASAGTGSKKPGTSGGKKPKPTASTTKKASGGGTKTDPGTGTGGTGTVVDPPASPSPTTSAVTSPDPSPSGASGAAGGTTNNAADGPAAQTPVTAGGPSAATPARPVETTL
jgi:hypothetical protein